MHDCWNAVRLRITRELVLGQTRNAHVHGREHCQPRAAYDVALARLAHEGDELLLRSPLPIEAVNRRARLAARHLRIVVDDQARAHQDLILYLYRVDEV